MGQQPKIQMGQSEVEAAGGVEEAGGAGAAAGPEAAVGGEESAVGKAEAAVGEEAAAGGEGAAGAAAEEAAGGEEAAGRAAGGVTGAAAEGKSILESVQCFDLGAAAGSVHCVGSGWRAAGVDRYHGIFMVARHAGIKNSITWQRFE